MKTIWVSLSMIYMMGLLFVMINMAVFLLIAKSFVPRTAKTA